MSKIKTNIDDLIRNGFTVSDDELLFDSWDEIENRLDSGSDLDSKIVEAFDIKSSKIPFDAWPVINEELDIDTVWRRISVKLKRKKRFGIFWKNAAAIGLLLILTTLFFKQEIEQFIVFSDSTNISSKAYLNDTNDSKSPELIIYCQKRNQGWNDQNSKGIFQDETPNLNKKVFVNEEFNLHSCNDHFISQHSPSIEREIITNLNSPVMSPLNRQLNYPNWPNSSSNDIDSEKKPVKYPKWQIGAMFNLSNGILSDATTRSAFSKNTLASNNFTLSLNYGVFGQIEMKNNYFIQSEFFFNQSVNRSVQEYSHFRYQENSLKLDYLQLSISAGRNIVLSEDLGVSLQPSLGLFGAFLKSAKNYQENEFVSNDTNYKKWNHGIQLNLGFQNEYDRLTLGYGFQSSIGLSNIFSGSENQSSLLNVSRSFTNGVYFKLGIKL